MGRMEGFMVEDTWDAEGERGKWMKWPKGKCRES